MLTPPSHNTFTAYGAGHIFRYVTNQPPKANSAVHPSGVGKWVPASAGKAKAGMVHSVSGCTQGVQVKLWDPLRTRAIPERLRGVFRTRRYTNSRLPLPLPLPTIYYISLLCCTFLHCFMPNRILPIGQSKWLLSSMHNRTVRGMQLLSAKLFTN